MKRQIVMLLFVLVIAIGISGIAAATDYSCPQKDSWKCGDSCKWDQKYKENDYKWKTHKWKHDKKRKHHKKLKKKLENM